MRRDARGQAVWLELVRAGYGHAQGGLGWHVWFEVFKWPGGSYNVWVKKKWQAQFDSQSLNSLTWARFQTLSNPNSTLGAVDWWLERFAGSRRVRNSQRVAEGNCLQLNWFSSCFPCSSHSLKQAFRARNGLHKASVNITKSSARLTLTIYIHTNREWAQVVTTFTPGLKINPLMSLFCFWPKPGKKIDLCFVISLLLSYYYCLPSSISLLHT